MKDLTKLTKLNLLGANVTDAGLDALRGLVALEELNLYRTNITNAGVEKLKAFPRLRALDVRYTRVTGGGVASLAVGAAEVPYRFSGRSGGQTASAPKAPAGSDPRASPNGSKQRGGKAKLENGQIREVSFLSTGLTDAELGALPGLASVKKLNLQATEIGDVGIKKLTRVLCRWKNWSSPTQPSRTRACEALAECKSFRKLGAGSTLVHGVGLDRLQSLTDLDLSGTSLSAEALKQLGALKNLKRLSLKYSDITDSGLESLDVAFEPDSSRSTGTDVSDAGLAHIGKLAGLEELLMSYGRFTDAGLASLGGLTHLVRLDLVRTRTSDKGLANLAPLKNLTSLNLDYTTVTDKGLCGSVRRFRNLLQLRLDSATITDTGVETLSALKGLKMLNLYHTLVTDAGYQALRRALPHCKIVWDRESALPTRRGS